MINAIIDYPPVLSSNEVFDYVNELHETGYDARPFEDPDWIAQSDEYILVWLPLAESAIHWNKGIHGDMGYHLLESPMPPIVIGNNLFIIDGMHRYTAAAHGEHSHILAYLPKSHAHLGVAARTS